MLIYIGNIAFLKKNWTSTEIAYDTEIARRHPISYRIVFYLQRFSITKKYLTILILRSEKMTNYQLGIQGPGEKNPDTRT